MGNRTERWKKLESGCFSCSQVFHFSSYSEECHYSASSRIDIVLRFREALYRFCVVWLQRRQRSRTTMSHIVLTNSVRRFASGCASVVIPLLPALPPGGSWNPGVALARSFKAFLADSRGFRFFQ